MVHESFRRVASLARVYGGNEDFGLMSTTPSFSASGLHFSPCTLNLCLHFVPAFHVLFAEIRSRSPPRRRSRSRSREAASRRSHRSRSRSLSSRRERKRRDPSVTNGSGKKSDDERRSRSEVSTVVLRVL